MSQRYERLTEDEALTGHIWPSLRRLPTPVHEQEIVLPTRGILSRVTALFPGLRAMTAAKDFSFLRLSPYWTRGLNSQTPLANTLPTAPPAGGLVSTYDLALHLRTAEEEARRCGMCLGKGTVPCRGCVANARRKRGPDLYCRFCLGSGVNLCGKCEGSSSQMFGLLATFSLDRDDYFWVTKFDYAYSLDGADNIQPLSIKTAAPEFYKCDGLRGLSDLAATPFAQTKTDAKHIRFSF